ncbi:MAG TPA: glycosyltransferase [Verrucomicrobiales bacterium]|nr:glycosyltransferase [Verrucomicrobiales bacterium]
MTQPPDYSIVIPAWNEEAFLPRTLERLQGAMHTLERPGEIVVADNASTDATAAIARRAGARVVHEPHRQISRARNAGAAAAAGALLIFLDADTLVEGPLLRETLRLADSGSCCGGGAQLRPDSQTPAAVVRLIHRWNSLSRLLGWAAGCYLFCSKRAWQDIGGFSEKVYAGEEIWMSRALHRWGRRRGMRFVIIAEDGPMTSARKAQWFSPWQLGWRVAAILLFPFITRYRRFCDLWYRRPPAPGASSAAPDQILK